VVPTGATPTTQLAIAGIQAGVPLLTSLFGKLFSSDAGTPTPTYETGSIGTSDILRPVEAWAPSAYEPSWADLMPASYEAVYEPSDYGVYEA
jgi:hypothetical protein